MSEAREGGAGEGTRPKCRGWVKLLGGVLRWTLVGGVILGLVMLFWLRQALYHRWVRFPEEERAWAELQAQRQPVPAFPGWQDYRGILHSHSELSHDCEVPFAEILRVMHETGRDFICLSDHCDEGRADFGAQWRGLHEGKLFIPGFEMRRGYMPFGVKSGVVLSNQMDSAALARAVVAQGGVLFFAHPEEPREWDQPELTGMEIYNTHADFKDEGNGLLRLLPDLWVNQRRYPDQVFRTLFDRPAAVLARWDELNRGRRITGIAGNDCHQNTGVRGWYTAGGTLRIEDTSPETLGEWRLNGWTRGLLECAVGPLEPGRKLFQVQLDPYERMVRHVTTHVLAEALSEKAILDALRAGRAFVGFDRLADSHGFLWWAEPGEAGLGERVLMGGSLEGRAGLRLRARAPVPCRFLVLRHGVLVHTGEGRELSWVPAEPGKYRVEAEVNIAGRWTPWVFTNPIEIR